MLGAAARLMRAERVFLSLREGGETSLLRYPRSAEAPSAPEVALLERALAQRVTAVEELTSIASVDTTLGPAAEAAATPLLVAHRTVGPPQDASFVGRVEAIGVLLVARSLARGGFTADELAVLESLAADAAMAIDGARLYREAREKAKIDHEMALARSLQSALLRQPPTVPFAEVFAISQPARSVGGDLYHGALLPGGGLALAVGDISGKGVSAALLMAPSRVSSSSSTTSAGRSPRCCRRSTARSAATTRGTASAHWPPPTSRRTARSSWPARATARWRCCGATAA